MKQFRIASIVEGHGEERAVPILLNLWFKERNLSRYFAAYDRAIRAAGCGALKAPHTRDTDLGVEHYVERTLPGKPDGILIVMDADGECLKRTQSGTEKLGPELLRRAQSVAPADLPIGVVIANREYEIWFLAQLRRLQMCGVLPPSVAVSLPGELEALPNPKAVFEKLFHTQSGRYYQETIDQQDVTAHLGFRAGALTRSASYRKMDRELQRLTVLIRLGRGQP